MNPFSYSFKVSRPESLVDLNFNYKPHEKSAYIAIGRARNSLGLPLMLPAHRKHLAWVLDQEKIRYRVED